MSAAMVAKDCFLVRRRWTFLKVPVTCAPREALGSRSYLRSRSSASRVGFCWAFSGVGWEACSCSSRSRWISCKISLGREEEGKNLGSVNFQDIQDTNNRAGSSWVSEQMPASLTMFMSYWLWQGGPWWPISSSSTFRLCTCWWSLQAESSRQDLIISLVSNIMLW